MNNAHRLFRDKIESLSQEQRQSLETSKNIILDLMMSHGKNVEEELVAMGHIKAPSLPQADRGTASSPDSDSHGHEEMTTESSESSSNSKVISNRKSQHFVPIDKELMNMGFKFNTIRNRPRVLIVGDTHVSKINRNMVAKGVFLIAESSAPLAKLIPKVRNQAKPIAREYVIIIAGTTNLVLKDNYNFDNELMLLINTIKDNKFVGKICVGALPTTFFDHDLNRRASLINKRLNNICQKNDYIFMGELAQIKLKNSDHYDPAILLNVLAKYVPNIKPNTTQSTAKSTPTFKK